MHLTSLSKVLKLDNGFFYVVHIYKMFAIFSVGGIFSPRKCQGIQLVHPKTFYPFDWAFGSSLNNHETAEFWRDKFKDSYSVDFYSTSSNQPGHIRIMKPRFYGAKMPAYAYLGPKFCPVAFESEKLF